MASPSRSTHQTISRGNYRSPVHFWEPSQGIHMLSSSFQESPWGQRQPPPPGKIWNPPPPRDAYATICYNKNNMNMIAITGSHNKIRYMIHGKTSIHLTINRILKNHSNITIKFQYILGALAMRRPHGLTQRAPRGSDSPVGHFWQHSLGTQDQVLR